jgi:hypothetical protein
MEASARLEVRLPASHRQQLMALAHESGLSSSALAKIGIRWLLAHPETLLGRAFNPSGDKLEAATTDPGGDIA